MNIEGFDLIEPLGDSDESAVWKANQLSLDRLVALRIFHAGASSEDRIADLLSQLSIAAKLKHPNLVRIYNTGNQDGHTYVVMEYIEGHTVEKMVDTDGPVRNAVALKIAEAVADALDSTWQEAQLAHGNLNPSNIMIDNTGAIKLADIGINPPAAAGPNKDDPATLSSACFKSPEHALGLEVNDPRSDMYCLGATLYFMLTGERPFDGYSAEVTLAMHIDGLLSNPREINPDVSAMTSKFVARLLAKKPEHRFENWGGVVEQARALSSGRIVLKKSEGNHFSSVDRRSPDSRQGHHPRRRSTDRRDTVPAWFRVPAWLLLFVFWIFLGYRQYTRPVLTTLWQPPLPVPAPHQVRRQPEPAPPRPAAPASAREPKTAMALAVPDAPVEQAIPPAEPELTGSEKDVIDQACQYAAAALLAGDTAMAVRAASPSAPDGASRAFDRAAAELLALVNAISNIDPTIANAFSERIDSDISVHINGEWRHIIPKSVDGIAIEALLVQGSGSDRKTVPVSFTIQELTPEEKARWLDASETDVTNAMRLLLSVQAGQIERARALAPSCGILADAFAQQL